MAKVRAGDLDKGAERRGGGRNQGNAMTCRENGIIMPVC